MAILLWDQIRRCWWGYLIAGAAYGVLLGACVSSSRGGSPTLFVFLAYLTATPYLMVARRDAVRTLLTMPVSAKLIGQAWWGAMVGIPSLLLALVSGLIFAVASIFYHNPPPAVDLFYLWLNGVLVFGISFSCRSWMLDQVYTGSISKTLRNLLATGLIISFICSGIYHCRLDPPQSLWWYIFVAIGSVMTIGGWYRAEVVVLETAGVGKMPGLSSSPNAKALRCAEGRGGIPYLLQITASRLALGGTAVYGVLILTNVIMKFTDPSNVAIHSDMFTHGFFIAYTYIPALLVTWLCAQLRVLRALPISTYQMAAILVFTPLSILPIASHLTHLFLESLFRLSLNALDTLNWQYDFLPFALVAVLLPALVWRGLTFGYFILLMMGLDFSAMGNESLAAHFSSLSCGVITLLLAYGSFIATKFVLERSSHAYHPRVPFGIFGGLGR